jgi:DNA-binding protein H-NS
MERDVKKIGGLDKLAYAKLAALRARVDRVMQRKLGAQRAKLKGQMEAMAKQHGFSLSEVFDGEQGKAGVRPPVKYRDPKDPRNTWTGRGRIPRWMAAALKNGKARKEDFRI